MLYLVRSWHSVHRLIPAPSVHPEFHLVTEDILRYPFRELPDGLGELAVFKEIA